MSGPKPPTPAPPPRQLSMPLDPARLRGMSPRSAGPWCDAGDPPDGSRRDRARGGETMTGGDALPPAILQRKAVVYVRQSTQAQVETNLEGRRRQYELVDVARRQGLPHRRGDRRRSRPLGERHGRPARLRAAGRGALRRRGRRGALLRRVPARPQRARLAPPARAVRAGRGEGDRPRRRLRPLPPERPAAAWA